MRGFGSSDGTVNAYVPTTATAYAFTLACTSPNSPATADMTVASGATQLADGATVFLLGDTVTINPIVNPPPSFGRCRIGGSTSTSTRAWRPRTTALRRG